MQYPVPKQKYKVKVQCCTYNQSQYIEDALKGFAIQQTNFPFVCCIFDDASTDGEQEVLKRWIENHCNSEDVVTYDHPLTIILMAPDKDNPNCIYAVHLQKVNTWGKPDKQEIMSHWESQCEYIALCEGDDYWIDPLKLQKQVDFLDTNPEYGMVYTYYRTLFENKKQIRCKPKDNTTYVEMLYESPVATLTTLIRSEYMSSYHEVITKFDNSSWQMGDYPQWLWVAYKSKLYCLKDETAVYRVLASSASHKTTFQSTESFLLSCLDVSSQFAKLLPMEGAEEALIRGKNKVYTRIFHHAIYFREQKYVDKYYKKINKNFKVVLKYYIFKLSTILKFR